MTVEKKELQVLQISNEDWSSVHPLPENMDWFHFVPGQVKAISETMEEAEIKRFSAVLIEDEVGLRDVLALRKALTPYAIFYNQDIRLESKELRDLVKETCAVAMDLSQPAKLMQKLSKVLFSSQYGDKLFPFYMQVQPNFTGAVTYNGYESVTLKGDYGQDFKPLINWSYNIRVDKTRPVELWLEYEKEGSCELQLVLHVIQDGSISTILRTVVASEEEMGKSAIIIDEEITVTLSATLNIKGVGTVKVGNLHQRFTRQDLGKFVLGGGILHDDKRQEINYFFYPGDFKPPLSVYFSGFRPAEGFEGFGMMRAMGTPFLLFSDPRLLGGAFYMGSDQLETGIKDTIQHYLDYLGFTKDQLILSGMSMGTYPSMYYGADFEPHAIITSKPLANIGTISHRARLLAPEVFPTGIDVLHLQTGETEQEAVDQLNQKFWDKFKSADFSETTFAFSYMKDEDMDPTAYEDVTKALYYSGAKILSKGTSGRHNDDSYTATVWFLNFYQMILENDFGRKDE